MQHPALEDVEGDVRKKSIKLIENSELFNLKGLGVIL